MIPAELSRKIKIASAALFAIAGYAQEASQLSPPAFEVVSVKPSGTNSLISYGPSAPVTIHTQGFRYSGDRLTCDLTLGEIIQEAYSIEDFQIVAPSWITTNTYQIAATMAAGTTKDSARLMLRTMLAERFGLRFHREQKDLPVYGLVEAKDGFKLRAIADSQLVTAREMKTPMGTVVASAAMGPGRYTTVATTIADFAVHYLSHQMDAAVVDLTDIKGTYEIDLRWTPDPDSRVRRNDPELLKVIERQLGLKLEKRKLPYELLVVDRVEKTPTAN